ncbi:hypothetical protein [Streptomyces zaomyceticus]|uniref:Uncharacterized protein n=1 Tax=Streptomyces zaomyceticus TaxID=68286 RepID=A0ABZ1LK69_9ACTN
MKKSLQDFMGQMAFQHANSTYLGLLGAPDVLPGPVVTVVTPVGRVGGPVEVVGTGSTRASWSTSAPCRCPRSTCSATT